MINGEDSRHHHIVVPYVGTWIEIDPTLLLAVLASVVPYVGTWIEMPAIANALEVDVVVPYVGTWIEIVHYSPSSNVNVPSFPTWERG